MITPIASFIAKNSKQSFNYKKSTVKIAGKYTGWEFET